MIAFVMGITHIRDPPGDEAPTGLTRRVDWSFDGTQAIESGRVDQNRGMLGAEPRRIIILSITWIDRSQSYSGR